MGITELLTRSCTQTAVYWGNPQEDGYGTQTYDAPIEIPCRWEAKQQLVRGTDEKGHTFDYICVVYLLQDVDVNGYLFLGTLDDLDSGATAQPTIEDGAHIIKQFEKIPSLYSPLEYTRRAFLTQWQYR